MFAYKLYLCLFHNLLLTHVM